MSEISQILEKLHQIKGLPRQEIAGCKYPLNEELLHSYQKSRSLQLRRAYKNLYIAILARFSHAGI
jgi:hypothetical protein